jgi:hypothetical protein
MPKSSETTSRYGASLGETHCYTHNPTLRLKIDACKKITVTYFITTPKNTKINRAGAKIFVREIKNTLEKLYLSDLPLARV